MRKPKPELLDTRVRVEGWAEALELQLRRSVRCATPKWASRMLLNSHWSRPAPAPPWSTTRAPLRLQGDPPRMPRRPPRALSRVRSRRPLAAPSFRAQPSALLARRAAELLRGCIADAAAAGCLGCAGGPGCRATGCGGFEQTRQRPRARVGGRLQGGSAAGNTPSPSAPTARHESPGGRGPGGAGRGPSGSRSSLPSSGLGHPAGRSPGTWSWGGRRLHEGSWRARSRAPHPPGRAFPAARPARRPLRRRLRRSPRRRLRAHTCLCPAPGDRALPVVLAARRAGPSPGEAHRAAIGPGGASRAVAGDNGTRSPRSFQLRRVELSGSGQGWAVGLARQGQGRAGGEDRGGSARQPDGAGRAYQGRVSVRAAEGESARRAGRGRRPTGARGAAPARGAKPGQALLAAAGAWGAPVLAAGARVFTRVGGGSLSEERVRGHARLWKARGEGVGGARVFTGGRSVFGRRVRVRGPARVFTGRTYGRGVWMSVRGVCGWSRGGRAHVCGAGAQTRVFTE